MYCVIRYTNTRRLLLLPLLHLRLRGLDTIKLGHNKPLCEQNTIAGRTAMQNSPFLSHLQHPRNVNDDHRRNVLCVFRYPTTMERRTDDREVTGSSLTHYAAKYGLVQASCKYVPLWPNSKIWYTEQRTVVLRKSDGNRRSGFALAMRHQTLWHMHLRFKNLREGVDYRAHGPADYFIQ